MRPAPLLLACVLAAVVSPVARAENDAASLREEGKVAIKERRLEDAVSLFRRGLAATGDDAETRWQMMLGLALAHELRGEAPLAVHYYRWFLEASAEAPEADEGRWAQRRETARGDADRLEPEVLATHARVDLRTTTPGTTVAFEGAPPGAIVTPCTLYLPSGQHPLELSRPGFAPLVLVLSVSEGQRVRVERSLLPLPEPPPPPAPAPVETPPPAPAPAPPVAPPPPVVIETMRPTPELEILGWSLVGVGAAAALAGVGWTVAAAGTSSDLDGLARPLQGEAIARDADLRADLRNQQAASAAFYAGGGALALGGLLVLLLQPSEEAPLRPSTQAGLGLEGRF